MWSIINSSRTGLAGFLLASLLNAEVGAQDQSSLAPPPLTLASAVETARENSRLIRAAGLQIAEAEGGLTQASVLLVDNPEFTVSRARRSAGPDSYSFTPEFEVGFVQRFEISGQRGKRVEREKAKLEVAQAGLQNTERSVILAVATVFNRGLAALGRVEVAERNERLSQDLVDLAQRRLDAGVGTQLELNAARVRLAEDRRAVLLEHSRRIETDLSLRRLIGFDADRPLRLAGTLPQEATPVSEAEFVARALSQRPDVRAANLRIEVAAASARLARAEAWPDLTFDASFGREEGKDLVNAGISVPLSLFNRNQGNRAATEAARGRYLALYEDLLLGVEAEVRTAVLLYQQAGSALQLYDAEVLRAQQESLDLVQLAAEEGELSIADVLVVQRELVMGRMGYLDARLDLANARSRLLAAVALPQTAGLNGGIR